MKDLNQAFLLTRRLRLAALSPAAESPLLERLRAMPGMASAQLSSHRARLVLSYDGAQVQLPQILEALESQGGRLATGWGQRLRLGWYAYVDNNAQRNARHNNPHCCNKPPKGYG